MQLAGALLGLERQVEIWAWEPWIPRCGVWNVSSRWPGAIDDCFRKGNQIVNDIWGWRCAPWGIHQRLSNSGPPPVCVNKVLLNTATSVLLCLSAFRPQGQNWVIAKATVRPTEPKIFIMWLFSQEGFANPWCVSQSRETYIRQQGAQVRDVKGQSQGNEDGALWRVGGRA